MSDNHKGLAVVTGASGVAIKRLRTVRPFLLQLQPVAPGRVADIVDHLAGAPQGQFKCVGSTKSAAGAGYDGHDAI